MPIDAVGLYNKLKYKPIHYTEEIHCPMLIEIMCDKNKGTVSAFCVEAITSEATFYQWVNKYPLFGECYYFCKMYARELWEAMGRELKDKSSPMGMISYEFEYWKMIGWSRFGVSNKNSRIRLELNPDDNPSKHYAQLMRQAASGDFTAGEIKQLVEAVNIGLRTEEVFKLQNQIDALKCDLVTMDANKNAQHTFSNKGTSEKD